MLQSVITRPWGTKTNLKTLCHFTDLLRKSLLLFVGTQYVSTRQIIRHSPQSLFVLKGEAIIQLHNIPFGVTFTWADECPIYFITKWERILASVCRSTLVSLRLLSEVTEVTVYTAERSMRLAELVLLSHVFILVGVTPSLFPFIWRTERGKWDSGRCEKLIFVVANLQHVTHNVRVERLHIDVSDGAAG